MINSIKRSIPKRYRRALLRSYEKYYLANKLRGENFKCPVCSWSFESFLPGGYNGRKNARCPRCGSFERHRTMFLYLTEHSNLLNQNLRVLHFAPEPSLTPVLKQNKNFTEYITADLFLPTADEKIDITDIPYSDNYFDLVIVSHVLQEVPSYETGVTELHRILNSGGTLILQEPFDFSMPTTIHRKNLDQAEQDKCFGKAGMVLRRFGNDFLSELRETGFEVEIFDPRESYDSSLIKTFNLGDVVIGCVKL